MGINVNAAITGVVTCDDCGRDGKFEFDYNIGTLVNIYMPRLLERELDGWQLAYSTAYMNKARCPECQAKQMLGYRKVGLSMREKVTEYGFVWVPTGSSGGEESGIVGYWHGEFGFDLSGRRCAKVEFLTSSGFAEVLCNPSELYAPKDSEIEDELENTEAQKWRDLASVGLESRI